MAHTEHHDYKLEERFEFTGKKQQTVFTIIGIGVVMLILGLVLEISGFSLAPTHDAHGHEATTEKVEGVEGGETTKVEKAGKEVHAHEGHSEEGHDAHAGHEGHGEHSITWVNRLFSNLWINLVFFTGIGVIGIFFISFNYVAYAGWYTVVKRVAEAMPPILFVTGPLLLITFLVGKEYLFHWTHEGIMDPASHHYDKIIHSKEWWLNLPFYLGRMVVFILAWIFIYIRLRAMSVKEDLEGGVKLYNSSIWWGALFLVVFGVSSSVLSWDWVMSIDTHWFSTLFGWYMFASWFVSGLAVLLLVTVLLKEQGYLSVVNENHIHDLGKFMFAFSIFWTYLWFSQFLLYYYANIPEEIYYFRQRMWSWDGFYRGTYLFTFIINFVFPFLVLMTRGAKRRMLIVKIVAFVILGGHYLDFYMMVMPGTMQDKSGFGLIEFGTLTLFVGILMYTVSSTLSKANLVAKQHPMLEESLNHHI